MNIESKMKKYIKINRSDGIGMQHMMFACGVGNCYSSKFIVDLREWTFFRNTKFDFEKLFKLFNFHSRAIVVPSQIGAINADEIVDLGNPAPDKKYYDFGSILNKKIKNIYTGKCQFNSQIHINLQNFMLMTPVNEPTIDCDLSNCVAVHGRFGNGESGKHINHRIINKNEFIDQMKKYRTSDFFVCSDSIQFIEMCKNEFGDRIKTQKRKYVPVGLGPGHANQFTSLSASRFFKEVDIVDLFNEAYADMYLLSKCSHMICNKSTFNLLARNTIDRENVIIL
jgi:hypothetical protein